MSCAITLLARAPVPGRVKTRLARDTSPSFAAALHEALTLDVLESLAELVTSGGAGEAASLRLALDGEGALRLQFAERAREAAPGLIVTEQANGDLGERMEAALASARAGGASACLVVGSDCLDVAACVPWARERLTSADAVLVPATDGGFVLLGLSAGVPRGLLSGLPWGTESALRATSDALQASGLRTVLAPEALTDVDDLPAWRALEQRLARGDAAGRRTRRLAGVAGSGS